MLKIYLTIIISLLFVACSSSHTDHKSRSSLTPQEAQEIAKEAYIYGLPLVLNYKTMYSYTGDKKSPEYKGEFNQIACDARVFTPQDKAIVTPNSDTPYCMTWVDMRVEPVVYTIPKMEKERFYEVQLIDLFTHNFAYISTVATGNVPGDYLLVGPDWNGEAPLGIKAVIPCETQLLFSIHRTQLFNSADIGNMKKILDAYKVQSLSSYLETKSPKAAPEINFPQWKEGAQFNAGALSYIDFMLSLVKTPIEEQELMKRFAKIGLGTEAAFEFNKFPSEIQQAIEKGVKEGFAEIEAFVVKHAKDPLSSTKIFGTRTFLSQSAKKNYNFDNFFLPRAVAAHMGLYGNSAEEALYPMYMADAEGNPLNGSNKQYTLTFKKGELPPVTAFWSLTMYDGKTQLLIDNPINRYLLNSSMMDDFVFNKDGSLTLYVQKESPSKELEANWLPAPGGPFYGVMRLYGPKKEAVEGKWVNPALVKVEK